MEKSEIITKLSSTLGRRDEVPNQLLAKDIIKNKDHTAINSLGELLEEGKMPIKKDCIKVLYEIGAEEPVMIAELSSNFFELLTNKDNRLQWGAMIALGQIVEVNPETIFEKLVLISEVASKGSVITRDHAMNVFVKLSETSKYRKQIIPIILGILEKSPENQFPKYAEQTALIPGIGSLKSFTQILELRKEKLTSEARKKRIQKVLKKVT